MLMDRRDNQFNNGQSVTENPECPQRETNIWDYPFSQGKREERDHHSLAL